jgi:hypothetical protein
MVTNNAVKGARLAANAGPMLREGPDAYHCESANIELEMFCQAAREDRTGTPA